MVAPPLLPGGGAGGGAISLEADGNGTLTIVAGGVLSANGGTVADPATNGGGGGSGGSIRLSGKSISNYGTIRAKGAVPPSGSAGGGRVAFNYSTNLIEGSVDVGTGAYQGTVAYNTPPTVSSAGTAIANFSNDNYRKRLAPVTMIWYSGIPSMKQMVRLPLIIPSNGRDGTLRNMTAANRVGW